MVTSKQFGDLLSEGIASVARKRGSTKTAIENEIASALGYSLYTIQHWQRGHLPKKEHSAFVVRYCVSNGRVDYSWASRLLSLSHYPESEILLQELFPERAPHLLLPHVYHNLPPHFGEFIGRQEDIARVKDGLISRWPLISIEGQGGIGKTTLAIEVARRCLQGKEMALDSPFEAIAWTSAVGPSSLLLEEVANTVAYVLNYPYIERLPLDEKLAAVDKLLRAHRTLVVVDNFETVNDRNLTSWIQRIPEPSKALITSRYRQLHRAWDIRIMGLTEDESLTLIREEAKRRGLVQIVSASTEFLLPLVRATEGNPFAIQMAVSQLNYLPMNSVVNQLQIPGQLFTEFLSSLYTNAWESLTENAQYLLLASSFFDLPVDAVTLGLVAGLQDDDVLTALSQLTEMALLDVSSASNEEMQKYYMHPLTRVFATRKLHEVPNWKPKAEERYQSVVKLRATATAESESGRTAKK